MSKLKACRRAKGYTQRELAEASGVSFRMIQKYENGDKNINMAAAVSVLALADALGVDIRDLIE